MMTGPYANNSAQRDKAWQERLDRIEAKRAELATRLARLAAPKGGK
jgi:hypothetical protein